MPDTRIQAEASSNEPQHKIWNSVDVWTQIYNITEKMEKSHYDWAIVSPMQEGETNF